MSFCKWSFFIQAHPWKYFFFFYLFTCSSSRKKSWIESCLNVKHRIWSETLSKTGKTLGENLGKTLGETLSKTKLSRPKRFEVKLKDRVLDECLTILAHSEISSRLAKPLARINFNLKTSFEIELYFIDFYRYIQKKNIIQQNRLVVIKKELCVSGGNFVKWNIFRMNQITYLIKLLGKNN